MAVFDRDAGYGEGTMLKIGLALGGGGAKGFAHVPILEGLEEMGLKPACLAGSSIGAVIGALYAAGLSAREIREAVDDLVISEEDDWREILFNKNLTNIFDLMKPAILDGSLLHSENFLAVLQQHLPVTSFRKLKIPLQIVAADYWSREQVVLDRGLCCPPLAQPWRCPVCSSPILWASACSSTAAWSIRCLSICCSRSAISPWRWM
jgi:NTE family protein